MKSCFATLLFLLLPAARASAQVSPVVSAGVEQWTLESGHLGSTESRNGFVVSLGAVGAGGGIRLGVGFVPEGRIAPGWKTATVEIGPRVEVVKGLSLGAGGALGGFEMDVGNRHRVAEECSQQVGCMFEAPGFEEGWGLVAGASFSAYLDVSARFGLTAGRGWHWLFSGANEGETLESWSLALLYRLR